MGPTFFLGIKKRASSDLQGQSNQLNTRLNVGKLLRQSHSVCSPDSAEWMNMLLCSASLCSDHGSRIALKTACFRNIGLENTQFSRLFCKFWFYLSHAYSLFISSCDTFVRPIICQQNSYTDTAFCLARKHPVQPQHGVPQQLAQLLQVKRMTNILWASRSGALMSAVVWLASSAAALDMDMGKVLFVGDHGSYVGSYGVGDKSMSVVIDGLAYRGYFSDTKSIRNSAVADTFPSGIWGRAFLFASSAKVMKCKLDTGFPKVSGSCHDADGRSFQLMPAATL